MRIQQVRFTNYRGIREMKLDFRQHGNVLVLAGVNGSGKSSMLAGLAMVLRELDYQMFGDKRLAFETKDIKYGADQSSVEVVLTQDYTPDEIPFGYQKQRKPNSRLKILNENAFKSWMKPLLLKVGFDMQLKAFTPVVFGPLDRPDPVTFHDWIKERVNYENALKVKDSPQTYPLLDAVREALWTFANLKLQSQAEGGKVGIVFEKESEYLSFEQLSDGEQRMISLIGDIVRRFSAHHESVQSPLGFSGIVLIDEIDQHLHPRWQQDILLNLRRTFPNIQFIVSTHSPLILSSAPAKDILLLKNEDGNIHISRPEQSFGKDSNWILEEIMQADTRTVEAADELDRIEDFIKSGELTEAKNRIEALLAEIGSDTELHTKLALIRRREVIGR